MRERSVATLTSLGDAVIATDSRGLVTFLNPMAERLLGNQFMEVKGQPVEKVFPLFDEVTLEPIENSATEVMVHGREFDHKSDALLRSSNGQLIPIKDSATLIRDSRDRPIGAVLVFRDATYDRQIREQSRDNDGLAISTELLATASREIDTPLVAACDLIYIVKLSEGVPPEAVDLLTLAEGHLGRASHISREVLGFYREFAISGEIELFTLVDSVLRSYSNRCLSKNITIERDYQDCPSVRGSSGELNRAIANLVSNAVDAVPFGGTIRAELSCSDDGDRRLVVLSIHDNGPGISPANRDRLFEPFFTTKEGTGYGLGLWTAKGIIERHGGSIQLKFDDRDSSTGAIFCVFLPSI